MNEENTVAPDNGEDADEADDVLSRMVAQALAKVPKPKKFVYNDPLGLAENLPDPPPHDDDGFARSFSVDEADEIRSFFDRYGYVVVRNVLNQDEIKDSRDEFFAKFDAGDEDSITAYLNRPENPFSSMGIMGSSNDLESPTQLRNRQNERVYQAFSAVYGQTEMFVDHDRLGAMRPTLQSDGTIQKKWQTRNNWLHLDCHPITGQISIASMLPPVEGGPHDFDNEAPFLVQGLLSLSDAREEDGGFLCVPGSHRVAKEWAIRSGWDRKPFPGQLRPNSDDALQKHVRCIPVRSGSLVVWNQFTFHANHPNRSDRWRLNQYVRMYPCRKTRFRALAPDLDCYPKDFVENAMTPLGRKLFGIDP
mmetsp:Transcript_25567/g.43654  ORF Transcript_25567/g.43654 Transcript_25567/m.43654 type:complete len:363 (+) Transcript_25567:303-1391(+)